MAGFLERVEGLLNVVEAEASITHVIAMRGRLKRDQWLGTLTQPFDLIAVAGTHGELGCWSLCLHVLTEQMTCLLGSIP